MPEEEAVVDHLILLRVLIHALEAGHHLALEILLRALIHTLEMLVPEQAGQVALELQRALMHTLDILLR